MLTFDFLLDLYCCLTDFQNKNKKDIFKISLEYGYKY